MNKVDLLFERHSVRRYMDEAVAPQDIKTILEAGMSCAVGAQFTTMGVSRHTRSGQAGRMRGDTALLEDARRGPDGDSGTG